MAGETDLDKILASLAVSRADDPVTVVSLASDEAPVEVGGGVKALIVEAEGTTVIATVAEARYRGWSIDFTGAWLTIEVHTSLEGVGLTAALSAALADRGISCNVIAGYFHDHLLVPIERADEAVEAIRALAG